MSVGRASQGAVPWPAANIQRADLRRIIRMVAFLHVGDLHLGLRITRFDSQTTKKIREARFHALDNIVRAARDRRADFLIIAGDLFDDHAVDNEVARRAFLILEAASLPVFILPGNHDPLLSGGVWDRSPWNATTASCVRLLRRPEPIEAVPGVHLFPCPVLRKTSLNDPTAWIANHPRTDSIIRIGVAHGSLKVRDDLPKDDHLIARHAANDLHLDYLALGHWHSRQLFPGPDGVIRTAYCGVPEPMRFAGGVEGRTGWVPYSGNRTEFFDAGKGEALHVRVGRPGEAPVIEPIEVGNLIWQEENQELKAEDDLSRVIGEVARRDRLERRLLRLKLSGILDAAAMLRLEELREILEGRYLLGELDLSDLHVRPTEEQVREVAGAGILRRMLERLQEEAAASEPEKSRVAERAILLLYQLAHEVKS